MRYLFFIGFCCFFTLPATAQDYEWQWSKRGGGTNSVTFDSPSYHYDYEKVNSIAVDQDNNYYFLNVVGKTDTDFGGQEFQTYDGTSYERDIYIVSTDCQGNFRWQKTIGGSSRDESRTIGVDVLGGVYIAGLAVPADPNPVHFDTDSIMGIRSQSEPDSSNKNLFLIKYNTDGEFQWLRQPQKDDILLYDAVPSGQSFEMFVEENGDIHWFCRLGPGTHVNGNVIVPEEATDGQYMVLKYDKDGNYLDHVPVPYDGDFTFYSIQFHYDVQNGNYYIGSFKRSPSSVIVFNEVPLEGSMFLAAMDSQGNELWRHDNLQTSGSVLWDIESDAESNVYVSGRTLSYNEETGGIGGDIFAGYTFTQTMSDGITGENAPFLIKLDEDGNLEWGTNPDGYTVYGGYSIAVNGDEVALGTGLVGNVWDGVVFERPEGNTNEAVIVRFNKETGNVIAIEDILGIDGSFEDITALAVDNTGNYVAGGFFQTGLFINYPEIPTLTNSGGPTDFFVAQLAHTDCTQTVSVEEQDFSELKIHPNPTSNKVFIEGDINWSGYRIYSILGQIVQQGQLHQQEISMGTLKTGVYFLELKDSSGKKEVVKVVRE